MDGLNIFLIISYVFLSYFLMCSYFLIFVLRFLISIGNFLSTLFGAIRAGSLEGQTEPDRLARTRQAADSLVLVAGGVLSYYAVLCPSGCRKGDPKTKVLGTIFIVEML